MPIFQKPKKKQSIRSPYADTLYITKKIEIRLKVWQKYRATLIMSNLHKMWNQYCEITKKSLDEKGGFIGRYDFDKHYYPLLKAENPVYTRVPAQARTDMFAHCWKAIKTHWIDKSTADFHMPFRSWEKRPISSYHFQRDGIRFGQNGENIDHTKLWVPVLHEVKLKEIGYLTDSDIPQISSGRVVFDRKHNKWYLCLRITTDSDYYLRQKPKFGDQSSPIGIDIGIKHLFTISSSNHDVGHVTFNNSDNPAIDQKVKTLYHKIERLQEIISSKVNCNMRKYGYDPSIPNIKVHSRHKRLVYHSKNIEKLWCRIRKYYSMIKHHREDAIKKILSSFARINPEFAVIENLDIEWMKTQNSHWLNRNLSRSALGFARQWLIWKLRDCYHIPLIEVPVQYPSSKICSHCGSQYNIPGNDEIYQCPACGFTINRDFNAAINLLKYGVNAYGNIFKVTCTAF